MLDELDRKLLVLLQADASTPQAELGKAVGLSVSAVNERVRRLVARGVIERYTVRVNPQAVDRTLLAFIQVSLNDPKYEQAFLTAVRADASVLECHTVTGGYAYLLKVRCRDTAALNTLLGETLKALPGVTRTETQVALDTIKETHALACSGARR